jgi:hypothetical protein
MKPLWVYEVSNYDIASVILIEFHCVTFKVQLDQVLLYISF